MEELLGPEPWKFSQGSQLLIFSRHSDILGIKAVPMPVLSSEDAEQLFMSSWRREEGQTPTAEQQAFIKEALQLLTFQSKPQQHPLAIRVMAGALRYPPVSEWQEILASFQRSMLRGGSAEKQVEARLQTSYDQMPRELQQLFLDIVLVAPQPLETRPDIIEWCSMIDSKVVQGPIRHGRDRPQDVRPP